jgi:hypothetical protein
MRHSLVYGQRYSNIRKENDYSAVNLQSTTCSCIGNMQLLTRPEIAYNSERSFLVFELIEKAKNRFLVSQYFFIYVEKLLK